MQTYQDLKNYEKDLTIELDRLSKYKGDYSDNIFNKHMQSEIRKELIKIERYINKYELKFKYSLAWCCKYNKEYDFNKDYFYLKDRYLLNTSLDKRNIVKKDWQDNIFILSFTYINNFGE